MITSFVKINCIITIVSSVMIIHSKNVLHSLLFLVITFLFSSINICILNSECLALFFLIIYLGAIIILFVFVVMMLDLKKNDIKNNQLYKSFAIFGLIGAFFYNFYVFLNIFFNKPSVIKKKSFYIINWFFVSSFKLDLQSINSVLYNYYSVQTILAGFILFISVVGVSFLSAPKKKISVKTDQVLLNQLNKKASL